MTNKDRLSIYENVDRLRTHLSNMAYGFLEEKEFRDLHHCICGKTHDVFLEIINEELHDITTCSIDLEKLSAGEIEEMKIKIYDLNRVDIASALKILDEYNDLAHSRMK